MKKKNIKNKIKKEVKKFLKEQKQISFKVSENDPSTTCAGRGACCLDSNNNNVPANFNLLQTGRVICRCPKGTRKVTCEY